MHVVVAWGSRVGFTLPDEQPVRLNFNLMEVHIMNQEEIDAILKGSGSFNATNATNNEKKENETMSEQRPILSQEEISALLNVMDNNNTTTDTTTNIDDRVMVLSSVKLASIYKSNPEWVKRLDKDEIALFIHLVNKCNGEEIDASDCSNELQTMIKNSLVERVEDDKLLSKLDKVTDKVINKANKEPFNWKASVEKYAASGTKLLASGTKTTTEILTGAAKAIGKGGASGVIEGLGLKTKKGKLGIIKLVRK
jgi:hypothetical protein